MAGAMTVGELRERLGQYPQDLRVAISDELIDPDYIRVTERQRLDLQAGKDRNRNEDLKQ